MIRNKSGTKASTLRRNKHGRTTPNSPASSASTEPVCRTSSANTCAVSSATTKRCSRRFAPSHFRTVTRQPASCGFLSYQRFCLPAKPKIGRPEVVSEDILFLSTRELGERIRARKLSAVELTEGYLERSEN